MVTTKYSHAFLVGSFNGKLNTKDIDKDCRWQQMTLTKEEYDGLCSMYYKSHVDAIADVPLSASRPDRLHCIRHYQSEVEKSVWFCLLNVREMSVKVQPLTAYKLNICKIHIYIFPFDTVLFAIEIDESGSELDELTLSHIQLMTWNWDEYSPLTKQQFELLLKPLSDYLPEKNLAKLVTQGNKLKLFQVHQVEMEPFADADALLYEIATSSPIGAVHKNGPLTPSRNYYERIMNEYSVSVFNNWKALAIVDTFTVISTDTQFNSWPFENLYFPLIYLRCLFEKTFCFSRNNNYRQNKECINLLEDITEMEKYYFYDNISFNFLPNLLYQSMAKGLSIKEEREEISKQIKERAKEEESRIKEQNEAKEKQLKELQEEQKEKENKRYNNILAYVSIFAVFSVIWDTYSIAKEAFCIPVYYSNEVSLAFIITGLIIISILIYQIYRKEIKSWIKKSILRKNV